MDDKRKRALVALVALIVLRRRQKQRHLKTRNGRSWAKPHKKIIREHDQLEAYVSLVESLRNGERDEFVKFLRLTPPNFEYVLERIVPIIARNDTRFRKCVVWRKAGYQYHTAILGAELVIQATRCDWVLATTNVELARTLHNKHLTDSIFELASLRPAYIRQLLGVSRQIILVLGVIQLMYARH